MKTAVVGCGALGSYYGATLLRAGGDVHFLLRSDHDVVRRKGLFIRSPQGDFLVQPRCARQPEDIGPCDLVIIGLKTTANDQFPNLLPPLVGPHTVILTLQNGLGNEAALARLFPVEQIMGGLCFVCLNRLEPGVVQHLAHGRIVLGEHQRRPEPRTHQIAEMFRHAGVACTVTDNLDRAHWEKLVWNIPFNGLGVASAAGLEAFAPAAPGHGSFKPGSSLNPCLPTDQLLSDSRWETLVRDLMLEVIATARALGHPIPEQFAGKNIERTREMGAYKASTLIDFERGQPLELESLFLEPLRLARNTGTHTPRLERLCEILRLLDARPAA
jgi:2-dehydropantoate 2-reductase